MMGKVWVHFFLTYNTDSFLKILLLKYIILSSNIVSLHYDAVTLELITFVTLI